MFHLDNNSGIDVMPPQKQTISRQQKWFTEGDTQTPPSYPGADWFNIIQAELLNVLNAGGIVPAKSELSQLSTAIKNIINKNQIKINDASLITKGVVKLSSATNSSSETEASTPLAVKKVNDNITNAHARINDTNSSISNITDRLRYTNSSSQLWTANTRYVFAVRDDAAAGVFDTVDEKFIWCFNSTGLCAGSVDTSFIRGLDKFVRDRTPPVGVPMPWPQVNPPAGYFECNGSTFDKSKFPKLAVAYPAGKLPDLRGEFIRGWDNTKGVDPRRGILSGQAQQISAHRHVGGWGENSTHFTELQRENYAPFGKTGINGGWCGASSNDFDNALVYTNNGTNGSITTSWGTTYWNDLNPAGLVGNETRPRNVAFMYIVKAE